MRARGHLSAVESLGGKKRQDSIRGAIKNCEGLRILSELMRVDEAAVGLVEGIGREAVVRVELLADRGRKTRDETMHLGLRGLVAGNRISAREAGDPLAEGVARNIAGHVLGRVEEARRGVPAAQIFAGRGQAGELTEGLEHAVFVEIEEESVVLLELHEHGAIEKLHVFVVELGERRRRGGGNRRSERSVRREERRYPQRGLHCSLERFDGLA